MGPGSFEPKHAEFGSFRPTACPPRSGQLAFVEPLHISACRVLVPTTGTLAAECRGKPRRNSHGGGAAKAPQPATEMPQSVALVDVSGPELQHPPGQESLGLDQRRENCTSHCSADPFLLGQGVHPGPREHGKAPFALRGTGTLVGPEKRAFLNEKVAFGDKGSPGYFEVPVSLGREPRSGQPLGHFRLQVAPGLLYSNRLGRHHLQEHGRGHKHGHRQPQQLLQPKH